MAMSCPHSPVRLDSDYHLSRSRGRFRDISDLEFGRYPGFYDEEGFQLTPLKVFRLFRISNSGEVWIAERRALRGSRFRGNNGKGSNAV